MFPYILGKLNFVGLMQAVITTLMHGIASLHYLLRIY